MPAEDLTLTISNSDNRYETCINRECLYKQLQCLNNV